MGGNKVEPGSPHDGDKRRKEGPPCWCCLTCCSCLTCCHLSWRDFKSKVYNFPWVPFLMILVVAAGGYYINDGYEEAKDDLKAIGFDTQSIEAMSLYYFGVVLALDLFIMMCACFCFGKNSGAGTICMCCVCCSAAGYLAFLVFKALEMVMFLLQIASAVCFGAVITIHALVSAMKLGCDNSLSGCPNGISYTMWNKVAKEVDMGDHVEFSDDYCTAIQNIGGTEELIWGIGLLLVAQTAMAMTAAALSTQVIMEDEVAEASFRR